MFGNAGSSDFAARLAAARFFGVTQVAHAPRNDRAFDRQRTNTTARTAAVHPEAIRLLRLERSPVEELVVRDLSEVVQKWHAVDFVFVLTAPPEGFTPGVACALCCHWRIDLADLSGSLETARASLFRVASDIERRVELFSSLPIESLEREVLYDRISSIGEQPVGNGERR